MTVTATDFLLEASGISKTYGAVVALRDASLRVRPGEVHALMGANGAGKSTLVKILTGAVRPDTGTISGPGPRALRPLARRGPPRRTRVGLPGAGADPGSRHPVEPAPHDTPLEPFLHWLDELGLRNLDLSSTARRVPLASLRIVDLARALAIEPDVLMLDEMTAALPADLTERVLEVVGRMRGGERSVLFISHRMIEIAAVCDRATVLREGVTVGVVDVTTGSEERIVELMLGQVVADLARQGTDRVASGTALRGRGAARLRSRDQRGHEAAGRDVRPVPGRGAGRGRARGPGPGRAVRRALGLRPAERRRAARGRDRDRRSGTPRTRSGPASSTSQRIAPRRC
jgi:ribose transport system ATP-binding protein